MRGQGGALLRYLAAHRTSAAGRALQLIAQGYAVTLIGLAIGVCSARALSVEDRGTLALLLLGGQLFSRLGSLGFEQLIQKDGVERASLTAYYQAAALGSAALLPVMVGFVMFTDLAPALALTTLLGAGLVSVLRIHSALLLHLDRLRTLFVLNAAQAVLQLLLFLAVFPTHHYGAFYAAWLLTVGLAALLSARLVSDQRASLPGTAGPRAVWGWSRRYASVAFPETVLSFCLELPIVRFVLGETSAGLYAISNTFTNIYFQVYTALSAVLIRRPSGPRWPIYLLVALAGAGLTVISRPLITLLFGPAYAGAADYVAWMIPATFLLGVARLEQVTARAPIPFPWQLGLVTGFLLLLVLAALVPERALAVPYIAACYGSYSLALVLASRWQGRKVPTDDVPSTRQETP
ncbi:hypothetical protein F8S09_13130 [Deinococcus sp. SDU3-2]|uniref:Lipopolysaccharide biosynthesis protein n=1 Tax=Deinococcus terrestris TaxID=2651870 RepID=A0A7X1TSA7_9DEIO|nr:hypothetical protein [Deinococcus terrestris]MPY67615.1 hypothetical protein [Deinococcus terrestris]